jgi:hypothetical protein
MAGSAVREISLGDNLGEVVVKANGSSVQFHPDGSTNILSSVAPTNRKPGDKMPDGTVYAGLSPDSGAAMYVTPTDAPRLMTFNQAAKHAAALNAYGHQDWRLPTKLELLEIYRNHDEGSLRGTFNESLRYCGPANWYWSCTAHGDDSFDIYFLDFTNGVDDWNFRDLILSSRCLRTEPRP